MSESSPSAAPAREPIVIRFEFAVPPIFSWTTVRKLVAAGAIFGAGFFVGGGKLDFLGTLPHWPHPSPSRPDWAPDNPPPLPPFTPLQAPPPSEWRPLPWAPGWEGLGYVDQAGDFVLRSWRPRVTPPSAATPPHPTS